MRILLLLSLLGLAASATSLDEAYLRYAARLAGETTRHEAFNSFTVEFDKKYATQKEVAYRRAVFEQNYDRMINHNKRYEAGLETWFMKMNVDADLTPQEWTDLRLGGLPQYDNRTVFEDTKDARIEARLEALQDQPARTYFNWVDYGAVSSVKMQGQCGSCAAFATVAAIESCSKIYKGQLADDLSEQHLLDCAYNHVYVDGSGSWISKGCEGSWPPAFADWLVKYNSYNQEEWAYPYSSGSSGTVSACHPASNGYNTNVKVSGMWNVWNKPESDMVNLVGSNPAVTTVEANNDWQLYGGGVLYSTSCCNGNYGDTCAQNHAVLVVGYGHQDSTNQDYWIIKNSWSQGWGEAGFVRLFRGYGHCGVGVFEQFIPYCG